jgi:hypothetical protein
LLSISKISEHTEEVAILVSAINLLGSIEELPKLVENIKRSNEQFEALKIRAKKFGED